MSYSTTAESAAIAAETPPSSVTSGDGGTELDTVLGYATSTQSADATTPTPPDAVASGGGGGLLDVTLGYNTSEVIDSISNGESPEGSFLDAGGSPLSGTVTLFRGDEPVSQAEIEGRLVISGIVPSGVTSGTNIEEGESLNLVFEPSITGISFAKEGFVNNPIGEIQYGKIEGTVKDVDGEPVPDDPVEATGVVAVTEQDGSYELVGPGETEVTVRAAGDAQSIQIAAGNTTTINFVYSRLTVRVLTPNKTPVQGAKVRINNSQYETDSRGRATIELAKTQEYDIEVGEFRTQEEILQSGEDILVTIGDTSSGVKVVATDGSTGQTVGGTTCEVQGSGVVGRTNDNGVVSSISNSEGEKLIVVAQEDRRYLTEEVDAQLTKGEMVQADVELTRKNNTPTL